MNDTTPPRPDAGIGAIVRTTRDTALTPRTFQEALVFSQWIAKSTMVPQEYRGKPENVLLALQWGAELGLSPLQAIQSISVINGRPSVYGDALLAICSGSPQFEDIIERIEGTGESRAAICEVRRRGRTPTTKTFSVDDARTAALWGKAGPWKQYPDRMLQMRARGFALRDAFSDLLRGVIGAEEARDIPARGMVDVTPPTATDVTADLDSFADVPDSPPVGGQVADKPVDTTDAQEDEALREAGELDTQARIAAGSGGDAFRAWWKRLSPRRRSLIRDKIPEYQALSVAADAKRAAPAEDPFDLPPTKTVRDEEWWAQEHLVIEAGAPITFLAVLEGRLKEARTVGEVTALREDNDAIDELPKDIKEEVLAALLRREAELKSREKAHG